MRFRIQHKSVYKYENPVEIGPHLIRLCPASHARARVETYSLNIEPRAQMRWIFDPWGNKVCSAGFPSGTIATELSIFVDACLDIEPVNPFDFFVDDRCRKLPFVYPDGLATELLPFFQSIENIGGTYFENFKHSLASGENCDLVDFLVRANRYVNENIDYVMREESGIQDIETTLALGRGSCRDMAYLLMALFRAHGLAARFASGYLIQKVNEESSRGSGKISELALDFHAWTEVYVPGAGWLGLDPTSGLLCGEGHIPLVSCSVPELAAPLSGTASQPASSLDVSMNVTRLSKSVLGYGSELTSCDRPYDDHGVWEDILEAASIVDHKNIELKLNLTSGGEPTWTSSKFPSEPEWLTDALGRTKWQQAVELLEILFHKLGNSSLPLFGTGKCYPGEPGPRFALSLYWRKDGQPLWSDRGFLSLDAHHRQYSDTAIVAPKHDSSGAAELGPLTNFANRLCELLVVEPVIIPAYEESRPESPIALVLPLDKDDGVWLSRDWPCEKLSSGSRQLADRASEPGHNQIDIRKQEQKPIPILSLLPGESPAGLRLPLDMLRELPEEIKPTGSLTAICLEPLGDSSAISVFIPPLASVDDYCELLEALEQACVDTGLRIRLEGHGMPVDQRIISLSITPDPGVLEINMPVCDSFVMHADFLETLSSACKEAGLALMKFQLDGRVIGTGGGHHITLGGPAPLDSPFLERPDLLASMVRYFNNHPALSYLFTGLFVGPFSQAPRLDEGRPESLSEAELALSQISDNAGTGTGNSASPPWLSDRLLRHILVDITGSSHRAEICIDKLYNPYSNAGRLGLIELRAFEMPSHERLAAMQVLLVRSLVTMFGAKPYREPLVRWGSILHDRFMLPHFLFADLEEIIRDLQQADLPLRSEWYLPHLDLRFPVLGKAEIAGIEIELRAAHEPWNVLGDSAGVSLTSRPVDSSTERLQIIVDGYVDESKKILVNGFELPLSRIVGGNRRICAVRFRSWQPPHCLHPNIGVHHPLRFEVVDTKESMSLGACHYHVIHPEGKLFEETPLTLQESLARRSSRFTMGGHSPWPLRWSVPVMAEESQYTLDLRLQDARVTAHHDK